MTRIRTIVVAVLLAGSAYGVVRGSVTEVLTGTWTPAGAFADARTRAAAVPLPDGRTLIAGGTTADGSATDSIVVYDAVGGSVTTVGHLVSARVGHSATLLDDGRLLVVGGTVDGLTTADLEIFDRSSGTSNLVAVMAQPRTGHAAARLADGTVLIVGGSTTDNAVLKSVEIFDPATSGLTVLASGLLQKRTGASATTLIDGRVLVVGGNDGNADLGMAELYYPLTQSFSAVPTGLSTPRAGHVALLLPHNNGVLISGGTSAGLALATADLFLPAIFPDPFSWGVGEFAATGSMAAARSRAIGGAAAVEGLAFVAGGGSGNAEHYHFATIKTDKDDYAPGERAVITGTGWQPSEEVTLLFQEDPAVHDDYVLTVVADGTGTIHWDQWAPEEHDLNVRFYLTASDSRSRAQMTFTDSNPLSIIVAAPTSVTVTQGGEATYGSVTVDATGNTRACDTTLNASGGPGLTGLPAEATPDFGTNPVRTMSAAASTTFKVTTLASISPGTYTFRLTGTNVAPEDGQCQGSGPIPSETLTLVVNSANSTPTVSAGADATINEGATFSQTGSFTDPNTDTWTATVDYGDGGGAQTLTLNADKTFSLNHTYADNGNFTVTVTVTDDDGASGTDTVAVQVDNVAPTATFNATSPVNEGSSSTVSLTGPSDPGSVDTTTGFRYSFACDGLDATLAATYAAAGPSSSSSCTFNDNGSFTVKGRIFDKDNGFTTYQATVVVNNVAPTATFAATSPINEGGNSTLTLSSPSDVSSTDTSAGFRYSFACDGLEASLATTYALAGASSSASCTFNDNGSFTVKGRIFDKDDGYSTYDATVTVNNVAPTATLSNNGPVDEGSPATIAFTNQFDPSSADTAAGFHYAVSCTNASLVGSTYAGSGASASTPCTFADNGTFTVRARIIDKDDGYTEYTTSVTVNNVAPTATLVNNGPVGEGSPAAVSFSNQLDPSSADTSAGFHYAFSCSNGSLAAANYANSGSGASANCTFEDNGTFTVKGRIIDKDDGYTEYTTQVSVTNVAPTASFGATSPINEGGNSTLSLTGAFDPSADDTAAGFHYSFACDGLDGSLAATYAAAGTATTASCNFDDNGSFTVKGRIFDKDGGYTTYDATVIVYNVAPTATSAATSPISEGGSSTLSLASPFDLSGADTTAGFRYSFACDGLDATLATTYAAASTVSSASCPFSDNGSFIVKLRILDKDSGYSTYQATVVVNNAAPVLTSLATLQFTAPIGTTITLDADYSDAGVLDTHKCYVNWDDQTPEEEVAGIKDSLDPTLGSCAPVRQFTTQGVYTITVYVKDNDGDKSNTLTVMVTIFDPNGGFVTGGGWIMSGYGSFVADPSATGKANFGFVSKYKKGSSIPEGQTEFQFKAGDLNFHSSAYESGSLVVSNFKAQYKGTGTINGVPGFKFILTAYDGQVQGGDGVDKFRIKIMTMADVIVYDNAMGAPDDIDTASPTAIGGGSVVIHSPAGKK